MLMANAQNQKHKPRLEILPTVLIILKSSHSTDGKLLLLEPFMQITTKISSLVESSWLSTVMKNILPTLHSSISNFTQESDAGKKAELPNLPVSYSIQARSSNQLAAKIDLVQQLLFLKTSVFPKVKTLSTKTTKSMPKLPPSHSLRNTSKTLMPSSSTLKDNSKSTRLSQSVCWSTLTTSMLSTSNLSNSRTGSLVSESLSWSSLSLLSLPALSSSSSEDN